MGWYTIIFPCLSCWDNLKAISPASAQILASNTIPQKKEQEFLGGMDKSNQGMEYAK